MQSVEKENIPVQLARPTIGADKGKVIAFTPSEGGKLLPTGDVVELQDVDTYDLYTTAQDFARNYRLEAFDLLSELRRLYPEGFMPVSHYAVLARQIEKQTSEYETVEETVEVALALVKKDGFEKTLDEKGNETERIVSYELWQNIEITSNDVMRVAEVARQITGLIKDGVVIESNSPTYIYTGLADLKITMLAEATKDASARAQQIAANSAAKVGTIVDARMGVMQINPIHSYEATGSGQSDTSSYEKEITAVVNAKFSLE